MVSRVSYLPSFLKTPAIIMSKPSYCTMHFWLYWSFLSFPLFGNLADWLSVYWIPDCSSIRKLDKGQQQHYIQPFAFIVSTSIELHCGRVFHCCQGSQAPQSIIMQIISKEIIVSRETAICHMVCTHHMDLSSVHSWTTYELRTGAFPPSFRSSVELVTSCESCHVTVCVCWIDKSISTS